MDRGARHESCEGPASFRHIASKLSKQLFTVATDPRCCSRCRQAQKYPFGPTGEFKDTMEKENNNREKTYQNKARNTTFLVR